MLGRGRVVVGGEEQLLDVEIGKVKRDLGQSSEVQDLQPQSAFEGLTTVLDLMAAKGQDGEDVVGRIGIRSVDADTQGGRATSDPYVVVKLDVDFFAENDLEATRNYNTLQAAFEEQPWCREFERKATKPLDDNKGIYIDGMTIQVDTRLIPKED